MLPTVASWKMSAEVRADWRFAGCLSLLYLALDNISVLAFRCRMRKILSLLSAFAVATVFAQTEPQKSPPLGNTPPPDLKKSGKPKGNVVPPAPAAEATANGAETTPTPDNKNAPPFDTANMDTSVRPSDDFFMYANGDWIKRTQVPPEYSRWGSFNQLIEK